VTKYRNPEGVGPGEPEPASGYAAEARPRRPKITVDAKLTIRLLANQLQNGVSVDSSL